MLYSPLSTGSAQEDLSQHDRKNVIWDVKNQNKTKKLLLLAGILSSKIIPKSRSKMDLDFWIILEDKIPFI